MRACACTRTCVRVYMCGCGCALMLWPPHIGGGGEEGGREGGGKGNCIWIRQTDNRRLGLI